MSPHARGMTLIEAMIAVAMLGLASGGIMNEVLGYRLRVVEVRRRYAALSCAEAEVERLRLMSPSAVKALGRVLTPSSAACTQSHAGLRLEPATGAPGAFVLTAQAAISSGFARPVSLPFVPVGRSGGGE